MTLDLGASPLRDECPGQIPTVYGVVLVALVSKLHLNQSSFEKVHDQRRVSLDSVTADSTRCSERITKLCSALRGAQIQISGYQGTAP